MIPAPRLRSGSPRLSLGLGGAGEQRGLAPPRGAGAWDLIWGIFPAFRAFLVLSSCAGGGSGCRIWDLGFGLLSGTGLCPSPLPGFPSNLSGGGVWVFFFGVLFFHGFLPRLSGCAGNCGAGVYPAAETAALWRCAALSPWPEGQGGTRRWHRLPPPPPAWERSHLSCQHRPLGRRADVCVLLHVGVRASLPLPRADAAPSRRARGVFCRETFAVPFPVHPHPPRLRHRLHLFPLTQHLHGWLQALRAAFIRAPSALSPFPALSLQDDATESVPAQRGSVLSGSRGYVAVNFVASLNEQALPASSEG